MKSVRRNAPAAGGFFKALHAVLASARKSIFVFSIFTLSVSSVAYAASNAAGSIFGNAEGGTIVIENVETGLTREIPVEDGRFNAPALPIGTYNVSLVRGGKTIATREGVFVRIGSGSEVSFASDTTELAAITVTGASISPIDISATDTRTVYTSELLQKIPVGRSVHEVALLTPGVVAADSRYENTASFGGSAASENAFYINGYAVTNPLTNLGHMSLPFSGIAQMQAITGGYGAEFGRATGGVVNILTKSGTNDFKAGAFLFLEPESLRSEQKNIYVPINDGKYDGMLFRNLSIRTEDSMTYGLYAGGPIVKGKMFYYVNLEIENREINGVDAFTLDPASAAYNIDDEIPRWLVKLDWNITDNHLLDFTAISDITKSTESYYEMCYAEGPSACEDPNDAFIRGNTKNGGWYYEDGGELFVTKYTGYLTNDLTVSALYGQLEQDHIAIPYQYDPTEVYVVDSRQHQAGPNVSQGTYDELPFADAYDKTNGYRLDIEYFVGDHSLRIGYDFQESESKAGIAMSGPGYQWRYYDSNTLSPGDTIPSAGGAIVPASQEWVTQYIYENGGTFRVEQSAVYLEDHWQLTPNWLLRLGIRSESFQNFNSDDIVYVDQKNQIAPRLGATWDVFGDSTFKVFGQVGRYHLAMPLNVARRAAAGSTYTEEYFSFTGIDENGIPQGLVPIGDGPHSANNEYGRAPNPITVAASDLESHYQDELVIGFEKLLAGTYNVGARWVYRDLKSAIDDTCDGRSPYKWAIDNGLSADDAQLFYDQLNECRLFNPGADNTFMLEDSSGVVQTLNLTADAMGYPELKRTYNGIDMFIEYPFDGEFYYKVDYTWSKSYGNAEGQLQSDIGQQDVSQTIDWDHTELSDYGNGYLPNDRRHYIKAFGYWQFNDEWRFSSTFIAHSGRPDTCLGYYSGPSLDDPVFVNDIDYGQYYHYCDGQPSPRGSFGRLPWTYRLDVGASYAPSGAEGLTLGVDVFNLLDQQPVQNTRQIRELVASGEPYQYAGQPISFADPRYVRFTVRYDFE